MKAMSMQCFLDDLAAKQSTPGGGSAAAISGAIGAALVSMVTHFTIGKQGMEGVHDEMQVVLKKAEDLRAKLIDAIKEDTDVFDRVMAAYAMPKITDDEKASRTRAIQAALKAATDVPLACVNLCREVIDLSFIVAEKGNNNVISDAGVAVLAAYAGLKSAALNVYVNIGGIKDEAFANDRRARLEALLDGTDALQEKIYAIVRNKL